jgi:DNA-binding GntR family transcriptional regulator
MTRDWNVASAADLTEGGSPPHLTLAEHAEAMLRERIFSGALAPGLKIHLDEEAERLGMSPTPLREALRSLASKGLVETVSRRGYRVSSANRKDLDDTYRLRLVLDPMAARLAVPRLNPAAVAEINSAMAHLDRAIREGELATYYSRHRGFHFSIYGQCGSRRLLQFIDVLWENSRRYQRLSAGPRGSAEQRVQEHRAIARACEIGDADRAARLMFDHLQRTWTVVAAVLGEE